MSLSVALNTARSSLLATSSQIAVSGRNTAGMNDPGYSRKYVQTVTDWNGVRLGTVQRASDTALFFRMLGATSDAAQSRSLLGGLGKLDRTIGDPELGQSPGAKIGALDKALQQYANAPHDPVLAKEALRRSQELAGTLNDATTSVQQVRADADADMARSVGRVNDLLTRFEDVNTKIIKGTAIGADISDDLDTRDGILAQLSEEMGISVVGRANNDMVIYTDGGVTLFETTARTVSFVPTNVYAAGTTGNAVYVDGVQVTGASAPMPLRSGNLVGLATLRDEVAVTYQGQLDEIARGLILAFAEKDQRTPATLAARPGLFTYPGAPALPGAGLMTGLAGLIEVSAAVDPAKGGDLNRIRDGGINVPPPPDDTAFVYNPGIGAGYSARLHGLRDQIAKADRAFDPAVGAGDRNSLIGYAGASVSWLSSARKEVTATSEFQATLLSRASDALSNATGVNHDDEMATQLQLERSYGASAKLLGVIDTMFQTLLNAVR